MSDRSGEKTSDSNAQGTAAGGAPNASQADWFLPAIAQQGTVDHCFSAVLDQIERRGAFIRALRQTMRAEGTLDRDVITIIGDSIRGLENTLSFRLGILNPEREAAWFRQPLSRSAGPFASSILTEPVFAPYDFDRQGEVRTRIRQAWNKHIVGDIPFSADISCLWKTLLKLNADLEQAVILSQPFEELRLDAMPDGLPSDLESAALRAFLINVRNTIQQNRRRLDDCFRTLWGASEQFWDAQSKVRAKKSGASSARPTSTTTSFRDSKDSGAPRGFRASDGAQEMRDEFRRRRQSRGFVSHSRGMREALTYMGFEEMPTAEILRKRYLTLARKFHPDCEGGSDDAFKNLSKAYDLIADRVGMPR